MINFGTSGYSDDYIELYGTSLETIPEWLVQHKLTAYEIGFNHGANLSDENCIKYGKKFAEYGITLSVHAPYYINFANPDERMIQKSIGYILTCLKKMKLLGAKYLVFHPGALMGQTREQAQKQILSNLKLLIKAIDAENLNFEYYLCPETMGKHGQCGTVAEVAEMCGLDARIIPTLDFGHINAFGLGNLKTEMDYKLVFETLKTFIGQRFEHVHVHFSKVQYGAKGELHHLNFDDDPQQFGPDFAPLAKVLNKLEIKGNIVSESSGHQTIDAVAMQTMYNLAKN